MPSSRIITLLSDFGGADGYVGQLKGSLLRIAPECTIVDLSHDIPPQAISTGAYVLESAYPAFPEGTIHVAIVDPGVGSSRRAIAIETGRHVFLGPDNGLLCRAIRRETVRKIHEIDAAAWRQPTPSATFDGRDLFAPVAGWVSRGVPVSRLGPRVESIVALQCTAPRATSPGEFELRVVHVDGFGNVVLDLLVAEFPPLASPEPTGLPELELIAAGRVISRRVRAYAEGDGDQPLVLINSAGYLELACRDASASSVLGLARGDRLRLRIGPQPGDGATP